MLRLLLITALASGAGAAALTSPVVAHALRLMPGSDLRESLTSYCEANELSAAAVLTCVGSLSAATLRLAGAEDVISLKEELEIVSVVGTCGADSESFHLHVSLSRRDGSVLGGHIKGPMPVRTTAEIVVAELPELSFTREHDAATGYKELQVRKAKQS